MNPTGPYAQLLSNSREGLPMNQGMLTGVSETRKATLGSQRSQRSFFVTTFHTYIWHSTHLFRHVMRPSAPLVIWSDTMTNAARSNI